jgi:hypothetical protein
VCGKLIGWFVWTYVKIVLVAWIVNVALAAITGHDFTTPLQVVTLLVLLIILLAKIRSEGQRLRQEERMLGNDHAN